MADSPPRPEPDPPVRLQSVLRWVWLIIGLLLLVLLVSAVVFVARESLGGRGGATSAADSMRHDSAARETAARQLRYDLPQPVAGGALRVVLVRSGSGYDAESYSRSSRGEGAIVNVAFLEGDGARLLLDRPARIRTVAFPGARGMGREMDGTARDDSLRWIVYEMALDDTDGNGRIDELDSRTLYVSGLDGHGLRRVLPRGFEVRDWGVQPGGSLVVTALQLGKGKEPLRQRAFVLDAAGAVRPYAALDSVVGVAAGIVAKP